MVTVITRPQGHKIINQAITATITDSFYFDSDHFGLIAFTAHALSNGDYVYVTSDIDEYNGFWEVEVFNVNAFYLTEGGVRVEFYQEVELQYYQTQEHDWSSIFLPIVYKVSNDRWPTNSVDLPRTISAFADDNGYSDLTLSGDIKSSGGGINALEFVKISGASDDDLNDVWQIVEVVSNSHIVINLPYASTNSFTGASIQYYYNNYQVKIKIFGGLNAVSPWMSKKPYTEVAELSLTPDDSNEVMFSVSDYIKIKVAIKNNLTLFSLPLNLDAFTGFYISTAESFDNSDNYSLATSESEFIDDSFEGYAIAGKLPFKNIYSGDYADYIYKSGSPALWLTNHARLLAVEGYFFDISFIKNIMGEFFVRFTKYVGDYGVIEDVVYEDQGIGVYRIPVTPDANYDSFCTQVFKGATTGFAPAVMDPIEGWSNINTGGLDWVVVGVEPRVDTDGLGLSNTSNEWHTDYAFQDGETYSLDYTFRADDGCGVFHIDIVDSGDTVLAGLSIPVNVDGSAFSGTYGFIAPLGAAGINIWFFDPCACGGALCNKRIIAFTNQTEGSGAAEAFAITEEICIDILETCESINQFTQDARRLLEDGGYRLLE